MVLTTEVCTCDKGTPGSHVQSADLGTQSLRQAVFLRQLCCCQRFPAKAAYMLSAWVEAQWTGATCQVKVHMQMLQRSEHPWRDETCCTLLRGKGHTMQCWQGP